MGKKQQQIETIDQVVSLRQIYRFYGCGIFAFLLQGLWNN